jgi:hypothetical protein
MERKLSSEELYYFVKVKKILEEMGEGSDINISKLCERAGISRKTAYQNFHKEEEKREREHEERAIFLKEKQEMKKERDMLASRVNELELHSLVLGAAKWHFIENEDKKKQLFEHMDPELRKKASELFEVDDAPGDTSAS